MEAFHDTTRQWKGSKFLGCFGCMGKPQNNSRTPTKGMWKVPWRWLKDAPAPDESFISWYPQDLLPYNNGIIHSHCIDSGNDKISDGRGCHIPSKDSEGILR